MNNQTMEQLAKTLYCMGHEKDADSINEHDLGELEELAQDLDMLEGLGRHALIRSIRKLLDTLTPAPEIRKFTYEQFRRILSEFQAAYQESGQEIYGVIVFTEDSWDEVYPLESRSYLVSSNNGWNPNQDAYSILGDSLDHTDLNVRLDRYMADEKGGPDGWKVDYCYFEDLKEA